MIDSLAYKDLFMYFFLFSSLNLYFLYFRRLQVSYCVLFFFQLSRNCNNIAYMCEKELKRQRKRSKKITFARVEYSTLILCCFALMENEWAATFCQLVSRFNDLMQKLRFVILCLQLCRDLKCFSTCFLLFDFNNVAAAKLFCYH